MRTVLRDDGGWHNTDMQDFVPVPKPGVQTGLCETCIHARTIESAKGSKFFLCQRSATDPSYPKYPRLPVLSCPGYEPLSSSKSSG